MAIELHATSSAANRSRLIIDLIPIIVILLFKIKIFNKKLLKNSEVTTPEFFNFKGHSYNKAF